MYLRGTSGDQHIGSGVVLDGFAHGLPGFALAFRRDGTGVDDADICSGVHFDKAFFLQKLHQRFALVLIDLTP